MPSFDFGCLLTRPPGAEQALRLTIMAGWVLTMASLISSSIVESSTSSSPLYMEQENKKVEPAALPPLPASGLVFTSLLSVPPWPAA